jgi:hypothetical protein
MTQSLERKAPPQKSDVDLIPEALFFCMKDDLFSNVDFPGEK